MEEDCQHAQQTGYALEAAGWHAAAAAAAMIPGIGHLEYWNALAFVEKKRERNRFKSLMTRFEVSCRDSSIVGRLPTILEALALMQSRFQGFEGKLCEEDEEGQ
ncbi:hypothetical protein Nepgr_008614 [Nepenthes gracilis]|uniref:Uncharacterized protein n=1 Tax=Nepenthes gracilis TaxID=150966 RepID=A0AAD3S9M9_NEPGR|nr:hypothetical protein Nepgr_008614 [Nepenthes gracilis]